MDSSPDIVPRLVAFRRSRSDNHINDAYGIPLDDMGPSQTSNRQNGLLDSMIAD